MSLSFVLFGSPSFCNRALNIMQAAGRTPAAIVCPADRTCGRGRKLSASPTKQWASEHDVTVFQPANCKQADFLRSFAELRPDLGVVFAFGQLLPENLLKIPRLGFINIHPSLLPRYRGAAPIQWALINGDSETGVSIVEVTPRLDDGDVILQQETPIAPDETAVELGERLADAGGELLLAALDLLEKGKAAPRAQDDSNVVWAPALRKSDGRIDWNRPAGEIHNLVRGVQPWPGAQTGLRGKALKIHRTSPEPDADNIRKAGEVLVAAGSDLVVGTGDGRLRIEELQLEGKKRLTAREFMAGRQIKAGDVLKTRDLQINAVEK